MPNRQIQRYNQFLQQIPELFGFYSGRTLAAIGDRFINSISEAPYFTSVSMQTVQISSIKTLGEDAAIIPQNQAAIKQWLMAQGANNTCCTIITSSHEGFQIGHGTTARNAMPFSELATAFPEVALLDESELLKLHSGCRVSAGFVANVGAKGVFEFERFLEGTQRLDYCMCFVAVPIPRKVITDEIAAIDTLLLRCAEVQQQQRNYGRDTQHRVAVDNPQVSSTMQLLSEKKKLLESQGGTTFHYLYVYLESPDAKTYTMLAERIKGLSEIQENHPSSPIVLSVGRSLIGDNVVTLPKLEVTSNGVDSLWANQIASAVSLDTIATWFSLPVQSHLGYQVTKLNQEQPMQFPFGEQRRTDSRADQKIFIGEMQNGERFSLSSEELRRHTLIVGATQSGKTTTATRLLLSAQQQGIQFVVIEAANRHYWRLLELQPLQLYSASGDALKLRINPFQPEYGTRIDNHAQGLIQAFLSVFDQIDPIPQVVQRLVYLCYDKYHWDFEEEAKPHRQYPCMADMLELLPKALDCYSDAETISRVSGAIKMRLIEFTTGTLGNVIEGKENIAFEALFSRCAVIELEAFTGPVKQFMALLLAQKANEYLRNQSQAVHSELKRLLIIEEAHHVLPIDHSDGLRRVDVGAYFSDMLAEISAFGAGLVVIDQRPGMLNGGAIANTGVKIIHALNEHSDMEAISKSMDMTKIEQQLVRSQIPGQAIVSTHGSISHYQIQVKPPLFPNPASFLWRMYVSSQEKLPVVDYEFALAVFSAAGHALTGLKRTINTLQAQVGGVFSKNQKIMIANSICVKAFGEAMRCRKMMHDYYYSLEDDEEQCQ